jgi:signal transduction histidine kinase
LTRSHAELALEYFYRRTFRARAGGRLSARFGGMLLVGGVTTYLGIISVPVAVIWLCAYWACELIIGLWWRRVSVTLGTLTEIAARRRQNQMIFLCSLTTSTASAPFLFNPEPGQIGAVVSVIFCAASLMIIAAQYSMVNRMFLWTAPVPALALTVNMMHLAEGINAWLLAALAAGFVLNARQLQLANTAAETEMVKARLDADRANSAKSDFLATISHEIRTPLNGVLGMAQAMRFDDLSPAQQLRLQVVQRSGEALLALLNDVLDMSKIEAGKVELERIEFDLGALVRQAFEAFLPIVAEKSVALELDAETCRGVFLGDPTRVRQILYNLLSNAVKFTEHGRIDVSALRTEAGVRIRVRDTGIGMPAETAQRMFEKFSQADASTTRRFGGSGLGLSICRELAALMGGSIGAESALGEGSTFTADLALPFVRPIRALEAVPAADRDEANRTRRLRILVAEDNQINQMVLRSLLSVAGDLDLEFVANGALAIEAWEARDWDLVLMDINMPVADGVTATRRIRARESQTHRLRTPIIAVTANAMSHQIAEYLAAGMDGHLAKPIESAALFATLARAAAEPPRIAPASAVGVPA